jgi:hypothetical protein
VERPSFCKECYSLRMITRAIKEEILRSPFRLLQLFLIRECKTDINLSPIKKCLDTIGALNISFILVLNMFSDSALRILASSEFQSSVAECKKDLLYVSVRRAKVA